MTIAIERDWKSDRLTGELVLDDGTGDITMVSDEQGRPDSIRQDVEERIGYARGEWFLDPEDPEALPMFDLVLKKGTGLDAIRAAYRDAIEATPGVTSVLGLELELNRASRELRIRWRAGTDFGEIRSIVIQKVGG